MISSDEWEVSKNEYIESVMELQKSLDEIDMAHWRQMLQIDSKVKENQHHLEIIEDSLIEELNSLKSDIDQGWKRLISEFEKLKKLRS